MLDRGTGSLVRFPLPAFGAYPIHELHEIACIIEENPGIGGALLARFCDDLDEARRAIEESYYGVYESVADYAEELTSDNRRPKNFLIQIQALMF